MAKLQEKYKKKNKKKNFIKMNFDEFFYKFLKILSSIH